MLCGSVYYVRTLPYIQVHFEFAVRSIATQGDAVEVVKWYVRTDKLESTARLAGSVYRPYNLIGEQQLDLAMRRCNGASEFQQKAAPE